MEKTCMFFMYSTHLIKKLTNAKNRAVWSPSHPEAGLTFPAFEAKTELSTGDRFLFTAGTGIHLGPPSEYVQGSTDRFQSFCGDSAHG